MPNIDGFYKMVVSDKFSAVIEGEKEEQINQFIDGKIKSDMQNSPSEEAFIKSLLSQTPLNAAKDEIVSRVGGSLAHSFSAGEINEIMPNIISHTEGKLTELINERIARFEEQADFREELFDKIKETLTPFFKDERDLKEREPQIREFAQSVALEELSQPKYYGGYETVYRVGYEDAVKFYQGLKLDGIDFKLGYQNGATDRRDDYEDLFETPDSEWTIFSNEDKIVSSKTYDVTKNGLGQIVQNNDDFIFEYVNGNQAYYDVDEGVVLDAAFEIVADENPDFELTYDDFNNLIHGEEYDTIISNAAFKAIDNFYALQGEAYIDEQLRERGVADEVAVVNRKGKDWFCVANYKELKTDFLSSNSLHDVYENSDNLIYFTTATTYHLKEAADVLERAIDGIIAEATQEAAEQIAPLIKEKLQDQQTDTQNASVIKKHK